MMFSQNVTILAHVLFKCLFYVWLLPACLNDTLTLITFFLFTLLSILTCPSFCRYALMMMSEWRLFWVVNSLQYLVKVWVGVFLHGAYEGHDMYCSFRPLTPHLSFSHDVLLNRKNPAHRFQPNDSVCCMIITTKGIFIRGGLPCLLFILKQ